MIYLVIGLFGGLIAALIASGKGRSAIGWGVAGFCFPVIAIVALVVAAPVARPDELQG